MGTHPLWSRLTERQQDILRLLQAGTPIKQIGRELGLHFYTIRRHIGLAGKALGIDPERYHVSIRMLYLLSKEDACSIM